MRLTKASGAGKEKADMFDEWFLLEDKTTETNSMSIKREWFEKLKEYARKRNKIPVLRIDINGSTMFCLSEHDFLKYREFLNAE